MNKVKAALVIVLVFVAGFAAGVVTTRAVVRHVVKTILTRPERVREVIEKRLAVRLRLDAEQRRKVEVILARTQSDIKELRGDFAPRFHTLMSNAESEVSALLTPAQRDKFETFLEENRPLWPGPKTEAGGK